MTAEIIKQIKEIELAAEERIKAAQQKAKKIILDAEEEAGRIVKEAEDREINAGRKQLESAEKEAHLEADEKKKKNSEVCLELINKTAGKMEESVNLLVERIVSINGNC